MYTELIHWIMFTCLFLIALCAIEHYSKNSRLPFVCWIVLFGVTYGILSKTIFQRLPEVQFNPSVIFYIFLPILIFDASRKLDLKSFGEVTVPSCLLAFVGLPVSMAVMAVPLHFISGASWLEVCFFTAIMSATDPVAISAVFKRFPIPEKLKMLIEGESLLNDGMVIILFALLSENIFSGQHQLITKEGLPMFLRATIGAVLLGGACGGFGCWRIKHWHIMKDHFLGALLPLIWVYLVFCIAQYVLEISGVIAVMSLTITERVIFHKVRNKNKVAGEQDLFFYEELWSFIGDLANSLLFFILGVEIGTHFRDFESHWPMILAVTGALLLSRCVVVYGYGALVRRSRYRLPANWQHALNLAGLKGALSIALILMIPKEYPDRPVFLWAALSMTLFTLFFNTLGMQAFLNHTNLDRQE